jgi:hypothetical protein
VAAVASAAERAREGHGGRGRAPGLAEHWEDTLARLDPADPERLTGLVAEAVDGSPDLLGDAVVGIVELVLPMLPDEDPLERAIAAGRLLSGRPQGTDESLGELRLRLVGPADPAAVRAAAHHRLLAAAAVLTEAEVRGQREDPTLPELIRLETRTGDPITRVPVRPVRGYAAGRPRGQRHAGHRGFL